ncbi:MAG: hypothetical protein ACYDA8_23775 [Deferrisomatales bacterium]
MGKGARTKRSWQGILVVGAVLLTPPGAFGEGHPEPEAPPPAGAWEYLDRPHQEVSRRIEAYSRRLDSFFGGQRAHEEDTGSLLLVSGAVTIGEQGKTELGHVVRARVVLPHTRDRFNLLLESDFDDDERRLPLSQGQAERVVEEPRRPTGYAAAIRYSTPEIRKWHFNAGAGVRLRVLPDPFGKVRARRSASLGAWELRLAETLFGSESEGFGETTRLDLDRPLAEALLLRCTSEATYRLREEEFELTQGLFLFHALSDRAGLRYGATVTGESEPHVRATEYALGVVYRHRIYRKWVFFEVSPQLSFPRVEGFSATPTITFRLETRFGEDYL